MGFTSRSSLFKISLSFFTYHFFSQKKSKNERWNGGKEKKEDERNEIVKKKRIESRSWNVKGEEPTHGFREIN